jgi:hypothetical protein
VQEGLLEKVLANPEGIRKKHEEYEKVTKRFEIKEEF